MALAAVSAAPVSLAGHAVRGFVELDERVASLAPGVVVVRAPGSGVRAVLEHLARRVEQAGARACVCAGGAGAPAFHLAAAELGAKKVFDAQTLAEELVAAASRSRHVLLAPLPDDGTWDRAVANELLATPRSALVVLVAASSREASLPGAEAFEVRATFDEIERHRFLSVALEHGVRARGEASIDDLARSAARVATPERSVERTPDEARLLGALALAGRPFPEALLPSLLETNRPLAVAVGALVAEGALVRRDGSIALARPETPEGDVAKVADALLAHFPGDGWAMGHAAELLVGLEPARADAIHADALALLSDPAAKQELRRRWAKLVASDAALLLRAAARALEADAFDEARTWAEACARAGLTSAAVYLVLGRALMGLGDLTGAKVALETARAREDGSPELRPAIAVELAELAFAKGLFDVTRAEAELARSGDAKVALRASNLLGKIRLAEGKWDEADAHFAGDAMTANAAGLAREALRARMNRAIAILSKGLLDEAELMLRAILADAERAEDQFACAYTLTNLAVVAWTRHDYGTALDCLERTFARRRALGSPATIRHTVASLAELRLRLGLFDHAAHTVAFGRRAPMSPADAAQFAIVAARIALAKADSVGARREVEAAIADATAAADKELVGEAYRVAARISLDEGDVAACRAHLAEPSAPGTTGRAKAEHGLLGALAARAAGAADLELARAALRHAREAGDEEILCEILHLMALTHRDAGDVTAARGFCEQAAQIRARVADGLRIDVRGAFLAKAEGIALTRLQTALADVPSEVDVEPSPRTERSPREKAPESQREIVGDDPQIRALVASIKKVARSSATVLVRGESGTGKELVAEALHRASDRAQGPLVSVNCAALVETLLLSELFGHEKGAFTGAGSRRRGRFEMAEGGTLFLDEIGDISPRTQVALLRVLQEKTFERVGGTTPVRANVRIVCATHRDLRAMVERGEFREDLYYRLRGIQLEVPALRQRTGDIGKIADSLLARIAQERSETPKRLTDGALELLRAHRWPGNIRELENALRAASLFTEGDLIDATELVDNVEDLRAVAQAVPAPLSLRASVMPAPPPSLESVPQITHADDEDDAPLPTGEANATAIAYEQVRQGQVSLFDIKRQIERDCIARALSETKGNITKAAALLGMKRPRLSQLVKQYGLAATSTEGL
ncbi:MAG: sigma 54-interacting transcriptional regulator [Polyangiaceae bacterium]